MLFFYCSTPLFASNSGGTVVGNGAGIVESNFQLAYTALSNLISLCIENPYCGINSDDNAIFRKIQVIAIENQKKADRLIFLSEREHPGFFNTGSSEHHRIAKTSLESPGPIYINTDMLYDSFGRAVLDFRGAIRILVHELGHQAGNPDHAKLDILGSSIEHFASAYTTFYNFQKDDSNENVVFTVANYPLSGMPIFVTFQWNNFVANDLTDEIYKKIQDGCSFDTESFEGVEVTNGHFAFDFGRNLSFNAWVRVKCFEKFSAQFFYYTHNLKIELSEALEIKSLEVIKDRRFSVEY